MTNIANHGINYLSIWILRDYCGCAKLYTL